ncbi:hypothetical protein V8F33_013887 [Rhypophila sp. PSN 637]
MENRRESIIREISYTGLATHRTRDTEELLAACQDVGCFYLSLCPDKEGRLFEMADKISSSADSFFGRPLSEKLGWEMDTWGSLRNGGYKAVGKHTGAAHGKRDGFENFLVPFDSLQAGVNSQAARAFPAEIEAIRSTLEQFESHCDTISTTILAALSAQLRSCSSALEASHRKDEPSTTTLAIMKYPITSELDPGNFGHMAHTDVGSLTLLFTSFPGLEVFASDEWMPVAPRKHCIVINVGDTLSFMSTLALKSCIHRVVPLPLQNAQPRFSLAFFKRPELDSLFKDDKGRAWRGIDWHLAKYSVFREENGVQQQTSLLTGRTGFLGHVTV